MFAPALDDIPPPRYDLVEPQLDELEHRFGARKQLIEFIVEGEIPDAVEIGYDGFTVDGAFAATATRGIEVKDRGFIMRSGAYTDVPQQLQAFAQARWQRNARVQKRAVRNGQIFHAQGAMRVDRKSVV